jgi:carbon monoxide dehydrogenase subunit G
VWRFVSDPVNLALWWPRVVGVEFVSGEPGDAGTQWTKILEAGSGRRMRLDYTCVEAEPLHRMTWVHELEGTRFQEHLNRQSTTILVEQEDSGCLVTITTEGELKGAAKLASLALKGDQKKMLDQALDALEQALSVGESEA